MTDSIDRVFRLLVDSITSTAPDRLTRPFDVAALYQDIIPYRLYRRELGFETNQDYELTLMELLAGARDYLLVDAEMARALRAELDKGSPDPGAFRQFATAQVSINPDALARVAQEAGGRAASQPSTPTPHPGRAEPATLALPGSGAISAVPSAAPGPTPTQAGRPTFVPAAGESCRFCGGNLPAGRPITYCPHCGQDQTILHCDACGSELEVGWSFCTTCGRKVASS